MKKKSLFLFDLDGTLVSTGGAGLKALNKSFHELYGISSVIEKINPGGKTDPAIFREIVKIFLERDLDQPELAIISEKYLSHLESEMKVSVGRKVLKGVKEFLDHLKKFPSIAVGLGTGNLERGARIKLEPLMLNPYFEFGGFGSDAEDRAHMLTAGHAKAQKHHNARIDSENVFVIGDTVLDINAARRAGFKVIAVASGKVSASELQSANPDFLWNDMTDGFNFMKEKS